MTRDLRSSEAFGNSAVGVTLSDLLTIFTGRMRQKRYAVKVAT